MRSTNFFVISVLGVLTISTVFSQSKKEGDLIAKGAVLTRVSSDFKFTEGPAVDPNGNVFFTDQPTDKIMKWSVDGKLSVYMENAGRSNGLYFDNDGNLLSCADLNNQLWLIDKNKKVTVLVNDFEGKKLNGPNDLW